MTFKHILQSASVFMLGLTILTPQVSAQSQRQLVVIDKKGTPISVSNTNPFYIYFEYNGALFSDIDIRNAVANLRIDGQGLEFIPGSFEDFFYGSPTRRDNEVPPDTVTCNASYTGPKYSIGSSLGTTTTLNYGLQSAYNGTGGTANATLREKHSGCVKVPLKVSANAQPGSEIRVLFDEDSAGSPDYPADKRPPIVAVDFRLSGAASSSSSVVSSTPASSSVSSSRSSSSSLSSVSSSRSSSQSSSSISSSRSSSRSSSSSSSIMVISSSSSQTPIYSSSASSKPSKPVLDRTGGPALLTVLILMSGGVIGYITYKTRKKLGKVDINNDTESK